MKDIFKNMLDANGVEGVFYFDSDGQILFKAFKPNIKTKLEAKSDTPDWPAFLQSFDKIKEADIIFENQRFFIRKTDTGFLFILLKLSTNCGMIRLLSEIIMPELNRVKKSKGLGRFFKKK